MISPSFLKSSFAFNTNIIHAHAENLTHADSLVQLPFDSNCLNWVLGHVVQSRCYFLKLLGGESVLTHDQYERYIGGSPPITGDADDIMKLDELLSALDEAQARIAAALDATTTEALNTPDADGKVLAKQLGQSHMLS